jgi:hypothetical protein
LNADEKHYHRRDYQRKNNAYPESQAGGVILRHILKFLNNIVPIGILYPTKYLLVLNI